MDSDTPREIPTELVDNDARSRSRDSIIRKVLCAVGLVGVVLSALYLAPSGPFDDAEACGLSLLHIFVAILCLSIVLLKCSGPNVAANHGGIGLLVGLFISFNFNASLKAGMIFFLLGAFPGAIFGLLIGTIRRKMAALPLASANGTGGEPMQDDNGTSGCIEQTSPGLAADSPKAMLRFRLRSLLILIFVLCAVLAVLVPSVRHLRCQTQLMQCQNNLKQISLALQNYHDVQKSFPCAITYAADGTPMHSWRRLILIYTEMAVRWPDYDYGEPWNGTNNRLSHNGWCPMFYRCPSAPRSQQSACTNYVMLIDDRPGKPNGPPHRPGSVPLNYDDKSAVIVIEIADSDIRWMEPRDVLLSELSMRINDRSTRSLSSYHGGACIAHADGSVEILDEAATEERVRALLAQ